MVVGVHSAVSAGVLAVLIALCATVVSAAETVPLAAARSWIYQLQGDTGRIARLTADVAVVDWDHVRTRAALELIKRKPDRTPRAVLGYLSIGEAEDTRAYWKACCTDGRKPPWLTDRTQGWPGNFAVRYWEADWQLTVKSRLSQLIEAGFDGVYLDRADVWEAMRTERGSSRADMVGFVRELSAMARAAKPGFLIVVQNAEELMSDKSYLSAIDGIAKEDLVHGVNHDGLRNPAGMIAHSVRQLQLARARGKPVFVVEYLPEDPLADSVRVEIAGHGFIPLIADRDLAGDARPERKAAAGADKPGTALPKIVPATPIAVLPVQPESWPEADIAAARQICSRILAGLDIKMEPALSIRSGSCGAAAPIRLQRVAGVDIRPAAIVTCPMAVALHKWMSDVLQPAARDLLGSPLVRVSNVASYHCRNVAGGRSGSLSEHAFANAFDVADFTTAAGRFVSVQQHWGATRRGLAASHVDVPKPGASGRLDGASRLGVVPGEPARPAPEAEIVITSESTFLKRAHGGACGVFGTVLGPEANAAHRDHFHVDLAGRRQNALCE